MVNEAEPPSQPQALAEQLEGPCLPAQLALYASEPGQRVGEGVCHAQWVRLTPQRGQALFEQRPGPFDVALGAQSVCQGADGKAVAEGAPELVGKGEGLLAQAHR